MYDQHQFAKAPHVAGSHTSLSWQDKESMHTVTRKPVNRRNGVPEWANTDEGIRKAVLLFCEARLYIALDETATEQQRMARVLEAMERREPMMVGKLERVSKRLREAFDRKATEDELEALRVEVQGADREIMATRRGLPAVAAAVIYYSYRLGWDSVKIAMELGLTSPMVRIWLYRINRLMKGLRSTSTSRRFNKPYMQKNLTRAFWLFASGKNTKEVAEALHVSVSTALYMRKSMFRRPKRFAHEVGQKYVRMERNENGVRIYRWTEEGRNVLKSRRGYHTRGGHASTRAVMTPTNLEALKHLRAKMTLKELAAHFGCSVGTVTAAARKLGLPHQKHGFPRGRKRPLESLRGIALERAKFWTPEVIQRLKDLRAEGRSILQIAEAIGRSRNAVIKAVKKFGLERKKKGGGAAGRKE